MQPGSKSEVGYVRVLTSARILPNQGVILPGLGHLSLIQPTNIYSGAVNLSVDKPGVMEVQQNPPMQVKDECEIPVDLSGAALTAAQKQEVAQFLAEHKDVFALEKHEHGQTNTVFHKIPTGTAAPV
ncbi:hypothetical protein AAFF_G00029560 [Aldrovandia affinis]|uniref:Uncharacterized protein n=1 Tax=Aldrovandia affinis TaxID=143900 RepID=A0AAD7S4A2_9TELE|nr:hypothetical protein AAFF_G00029560 [Aldrovandia affinis]